MRSRPRQLRNLQVNRLEDRLAPSASLPRGVYPTTGVSTQFPELVAAAPTPDYAFDAAGRPTGAVKTRIDDELVALLPDPKFVGPRQPVAVSPYLRFNGAGSPLVRITGSNMAGLVPQLEGLGFVEIVGRYELNFTEGWLPVGAMPQAERLAGLGGIVPAGQFTTNVGTVTSEANFVMQTDFVQQQFGTGAGSRVGVISDSFDALGGASIGIANGDLGPVMVIQDDLSKDGSGNPINTDEGRGMLELVHDIAPRAGLAFATGNFGEANFAANIAKLADVNQGNANVIVDDLTYFAEPFYQHGVIAQAITTAYNGGKHYFSSAGNFADQAFERVGPTFTDDVSFTKCLDFDTGSGVDTRQLLTVAAGQSILLTMQWDQPFYTTSGVATDLDIYLLTAGTAGIIDAGVSNNITSQIPSEQVEFNNTSGSSIQVEVLIRNHSGPNPGRVKWINYGSNAGGNVAINEYATNSSTVTPHAAISTADGVAATPWSNITGKEGFTSKRGNVTLFSDNGQTRFANPVNEQGPYLTAPDGTKTSFFGNASNNFFGTSAAAPHAAAVSALIRGLRPNLSVNDVSGLMATYADQRTTTIGTYAVHGMVRAYDAVAAALAVPRVQPLGVFDGFESGTLQPYFSLRTQSGAQAFITGNNGPASGGFHVVLDGRSTGGALSELDLHVNAAGAKNLTLSFSEKRVTFISAPEMPATFTNSSTTTGVALSVDGINWSRLVNLSGAAQATHQQWQFDLVAAAASAGVTLSSDTRIRFQNGDSQIIAFDNIQVLRSGTIFGRMINDTNGNGVDNGEPPLVGKTIYLDSNNNGKFDRGNVSYYLGGSVAIPDNSTLVESTINVGGFPANFQLVDVDVGVTVTHPFTSDLELYLVNPIGTKVRLFNNSGGNGDNIVADFDDSARTPIDHGFGNFTGRYRPDQPLSTFTTGINPSFINGNWKLQAIDQSGNDVGVLNNWVLFLTVDPRFTANPGVSIGDYFRTTSNINVYGVNGPINNVDVKLNLNHTSVGDLEIDLVAPNGARATLFQRHGGSGDNFMSTDFDDSAATSITTASAPYIGSFRPYTPLTTFNGLNGNGVWTLEVRDRAGGNTGSLTNWSITIGAGEEYTTTDANGDYSFNNQKGFTILNSVPEIGYRPTNPGFGVPQYFDVKANGAEVGNFYRQPDGVVPTATSLVLSGPTTTNANLVNYVITFSEPVFGLSLNNVVLNSNVAGSFLASITPFDAMQYIIAVNTGSGNGTISLDFRNGINLTDQAYNSVAPSKYGPTVTLDRTPPLIDSITSTSPNKTYTTGESVTVRLTFSEGLNLTGTLNVTLDSGGVVSIVGPQSGLTFIGTYTIGAGQTSADLTVTALALSGGTFRDPAGNDADLKLPASNLGVNSDIVVNPGVVSLVVLNANDSGAGSLRQAILNANGKAGADTITFDPTFFSTPRTITLTSGQLDISDALTITGPGVSFVTISGGNTSRVFNTVPAPGGSAITLVGLTIAQGKSGFGPGVQSLDESVTLNNCALISNSATVAGGAIYIGSGTLTLDGCSISGNTATGDSGRGGGAIYSSGSTLSILNSTISNNRVTVAGNDGGGIYRNSTTPGTFLIRNSTFSGNSTAGAGGAIGTAYAFSGTVTVQNSTITGNSAASGGGIDQGGYFGSVQIASTIVYGNTANTGPDLHSSALINVTASLIGSTAGANNFTGDAFTNTNIGVNPQLGPLANNGGPTQTHALSIASPAVSKGSNPAGLTFDQRGVGFDRNFSGGVDIGAVEAPLNPFAVFNANDSGAGSLRQAVLNANSNGGVDTIIFDPIFFSTPRTIALTSAQLDITDGVIIAGPGTALLTVSGGNAFRVFNTFSAPAGAVITFSALTIANGKASNGAGVQMGDESVTLTHCIVANNTAVARGGAIYLGTGTLKLQYSTISNNSAGGTSGQAGGGIYVGGGALTVENCTISSNSVTGFGNNGGGVYVTTASAAPITIRNSTLSGNSAAGVGGALAADGAFMGTITIENSTITGNSATSGGGIDQDGYFAKIQMASTIVFGNSANNGPDLRSSSSITATACMVGSSAGASKFFTDDFTNANIGVNPQLGPLANNGGPTLTHALSGTSPAINRGSNLAGLTTDQRGVGFDRSSSGGVDIGAVEAPVNPFYVFNALDSGEGSLRQAILNANSYSGPETITFDPAFFSTPRTITIGIGQMVLTDTTGTTTIAGPGASLLTINANNLYRILQVNSGAFSSISGMTFTGGNSGNGGAILNYGATIITNSRFTNNQSDYGGAIHNVGALSVSNSTFDNNAANSGSGWGGAIINGTTIGVTNVASCTFTNNYASVLGGALIGFSYTITSSTFVNNTSGFNGGAIRTDGTVVITGSTFSGNTAANGGGAIMSHGSTTITNSTVANNTANYGGGIEFFEGTGAMRNVTVAYNSATSAGGGTMNNFAAVTAVNTIIAGNTSVDQPNVWGAAFAAGSSNNLLDVSAVAAGLGNLAGNGGPTQTIPLLPGSPAINTGTTVGVPTTDQRGLSRVGMPDIGAYELQTPAPPPTATVKIDSGTGQRSMIRSIAVTFSEPVTLGANPFTVTRLASSTSPSPSGNVNLSIAGSGSTYTITFDDATFAPAVGSAKSLIDGKYTITLNAAVIISVGSLQQFDGDGNGDGGDNQATNFHRLFGDVRGASTDDLAGNGFTDNVDLIAFRQANGSDTTMANYNADLDFNGDGFIDNVDFIAFRQRLGVTP